MIAGSAEASERQRDASARLSALGGLYTPQMIVDGRVEFIGLIAHARKKKSIKHSPRRTVCSCAWRRCAKAKSSLLMSNYLTRPNPLIVYKSPWSKIAAAKSSTEKCGSHPRPPRGVREGNASSWKKIRVMLDWKTPNPPRSSPLSKATTASKALRAFRSTSIVSLVYVAFVSPLPVASPHH